LVDGRFGPDSGLNLLVLVAYTALAGLIAARLFRWAPRA
jgi:hypothetical protein